MKWMDKRQQRNLEEKTKQKFISLMDENKTYSVGLHRFLRTPTDLNNVTNSILKNGLLTQRQEGRGSL